VYVGMLIGGYVDVGVCVLTVRCGCWGGECVGVGECVVYVYWCICGKVCMLGCLFVCFGGGMLGFGFVCIRCVYWVCVCVC